MPPPRLAALAFRPVTSRLRPLMVGLAASVVAWAGSAVSAGEPLRFVFGPGPGLEGSQRVAADRIFSAATGFGFEPGPPVRVVHREGTAGPDFVTSDRPFHFTTRVPQEGNYRVTVLLGDPAGESVTTVKAELRRLMVEEARTAPGERRRVSFIVNVRTPTIVARPGLAAGEVRLKAPRETVQEAWAWDRALTLEFCGSRPAVASIELEAVQVPTLFLLGDSTVCDQSAEPYASWGQMLTRGFKPDIAVANHGESGETYRDSLARRRLDKILSVLQPGDWVMMQFGHNDQKQIAAKSGGPFTTYPGEIRRHVESVRARGGIPLLVSPMERRAFDDRGRVKPSLAEYAQATQQVARELHVPFIDLNALSRVLYETLGPERSAAAFAAPAGKVDNTHHNNYGSYQLARGVAQAIRDLDLPLARHLADGFTPYSPLRPDPPETFAVPASAAFTNQRPLGDETHP